MRIEAFFDQNTFTLSYIVWDDKTKDAVIIDAVLDYDQASSTYHFESVDKLLGFVGTKGLKVHYMMETHAHADHLSGSYHLKQKISGAQIVIGKEIMKVQATFKSVFNLGGDFKTDGRQFDKLVIDEEVFTAGSLEFKALHTPGHTEACYSFLIEDAVFTGDALFMPDFGVGRC